MKNMNLRNAVLAAGAASCLLAAAPAPPANAAAHRVADLDQLSVPRGSEPGNFVRFGAYHYFAATDDVSGRELWRTDGTVAGTERFADVCPGPCSSNATGLAEIGGRLIFFADDGVHGGELWISDGTMAGTRLVVDLCPGACSPVVGRSTVFAERLMFSRYQPHTGLEPWVTDGTPEGTYLLGDLCPGSCGAEPLFLGQNTSAVLIRAKNHDLFRSDGTQAGTFKVGTFLNGCCETNRAIEFQERLWFGGNGDQGLPGHGYELWRTGPATAATELAVDIRPGGGHSQAEPLFVFGGSLYLKAAAGPPLCPLPGNCILREDGESATPLEVATDIYAPGEFVGSAMEVDNALFFFAGQTLFVKRAGSPRQPLATFPGPIIATGLVKLGTGVAFVREGSRFWVSDGTAAGTHEVFQLGLGFSGSVRDLTATDGGLLFVGHDGRQSEPWFTDGTAAGTRRLDVQRDAASSSPSLLATLGDVLVFSATDGVDNDGFPRPYLLRSDGSASGTYRLLDGGGGLAVDWGGQIFLEAFVRGGPSGLYRTDGNTATLVREFESVREIALGRDGEGRERLFVSVQPRLGQRQLWISDGTAEGTTLVIDLLPEGYFDETFGQRPGPPPPRQLTALTHGILFVDSGEEGDLLWVSDGTAAGSRSLATFGDISELRALGAGAVFLAWSSTGRQELWSTDGTSAGTVKLLELGVQAGLSDRPRIVARGLEAFLVAPGPGLPLGSPDLLWRTDGSTQGTHTVSDLSQAGLPTTAAGFRREIVLAGQQLFFVATNPATGRELWTSDGTATGTRLIDLQPGPLGSGAERLAPAGPGRVVFAAYDPLHGTEAWITDDSVAGAHLLADALPGPDSSSPGPFLAGSTRVYFGATEREAGRELWVADLDVAANGCAADGETLCLRAGRFGVRVHWRNQHAGGAEGTAHAVADTSESGRFWFFSSDNVELAVKILDGTGVNGKYWVFSTALSDLEYRLEVTDHHTGITRSWRNPPGSLCAITDVEAFPSSPAAASGSSDDAGPPGVKRERGADALPPPPALSLWAGRFRIATTWVDPRTGAGGSAHPVSYSDNSGGFWIFSPSNLELLVKLLDGRPVNGHPWLFWGALTHLDLKLTVTDTLTGAVETVEKPGGELCADAAFDLF